MLDSLSAPGTHPCVRLGRLLDPRVPGARAAELGAPAARTAPGIAIDSDLLAVAGRHHMVATLASALARRGLRPDDPDLADYLDAIHRLNARRNARIVAEIGEVAGALAARGVRPVFLKGAALLLRGTHSDPASRFLGDIDVLVAPEATEAAAAALAAAGFTQKPAGPAHVHDRVKLVHPHRPAQVELHHPAVPAHLAAPLAAEAMRADALPVAALPGAAVPTVTDLAIHNVLHAMLHDWNLAMAELPLRDALDLALLARDPALDWDAVAARIARAPQGSAALAFCLAASREAFPWAELPALPVTGAAARALRAWRDRRGRPTGRVRRRLANVVEHSGRAWRGLARALGPAEARA